MGMKHDDYPPGYGTSSLLDTYLQYIGENMFGKLNYYHNTPLTTRNTVYVLYLHVDCTGMNTKLAQVSMHIERKSLEEQSPQMGSLPPPPTNFAHQRFLKQMQRQYNENMSKPDIIRSSDEPLDLGKERQRNDSISETDDKHEMSEKDKDYYKDFNDDDRRINDSEQEPENNGQDEGDYSEDEYKKNSS